MLKVVVFDLDGVVADSSGSLHYASWRWLFEEVMGIKGFTVDHYEDHVSGTQRDVGLANYLRWRAAQDNNPELSKIADDPEQVNKYAALKQKQVQALLDDAAFVIPRFEDTVRFVKELRERGIWTTIASASENTPRVLERTGIRELFDALAFGKTATVNGQQINLASKPAPDVFTASRTMVGAEASEAVGIEDAGQGIDAIRADGMMSIGIERGGRENTDLRRSQPDLMLASFDGFSADELVRQFNSRPQQG